MLLQNLLWLPAAGLVQQVAAQYVAPGVSADTPVPGNYSDYLRPRVHFSPPIMFMNDPNGMHRDASGLWHLYYQYNPLTPVAGNQHWGHATSQDLYTWENQKIAIFPPNNFTYIYSGNAVLDPENTSGFFPDQDNGVVAIYTLAEAGPGGSGKQSQGIAYSRDDGYTFTAYEGNPVLDANSNQFRDPWVLWHEPTQKWVMTVAYSTEFVLGIFTSSNLKDWEPASNFTKHGWLGSQYECPSLVQMPMRGQDEPVWVLFLSINPGGPLGGSITQYFVGDFDGTRFEPYDDATRFTDFGKDNYAAQFFSGIPANEPQIALGWASNWQYSQQVPTGLEQHGQFRSAMTAPRAYTIANNSLSGYDLVSELHNISAVFESELAFNDNLGVGSITTSLADVASGAFYFEAKITGLTPSTLSGNANFTISSSTTGEYLRGGINPANSPGIWIDRGNVNGFDNPYFTDKFSDEGFFSDANNGIWGMSVLYDNSILEVFLNGAHEAAATVTFFPTSKLDTLKIDVGALPETASSSVGVWALKDTWAPQANDEGIVLGNATQVEQGEQPALYN